MQRVWVVESRFLDGTWDVCDFTEQPFSSTNYFDAHELKRRAFDHCYLVSNIWKKSDFRVREWKPLKDDRKRNSFTKDNHFKYERRRLIRVDVG